MFTFNPDQILTRVLPGDRQTLSRGGPTTTARSGGTAFDEFQQPQYVADDGIAPSADTLQDQFVVFQLNKERQGPTVLNAAAVKPHLEGSDDQPDALADLYLISFHMGNQDKLEKNARATIRINFGKDASSSDRMFETAYWAIAAGLKRFNKSTSRPAENRVGADRNPTTT